MSENRKTTLLSLCRSMLRIRRVEEALIEEYHPADQMRCPIHFCVGQEAAPAALGMLLQPGDVISTHYRSHGYYLAKGAPLDAMVAEFYGKDTGSNRGLGGSMELAHHDSNLFSGAIVGGTAGLAIGSAFAQKYVGSKSITVAVFGDGAMDEGVMYESLNLAALKGLPVLFLCENNGYAAHTALATRARTLSPAQRAAAFAVPTEVVKDADPELLHECMAAAVRRVRDGEGPVFLEVETYRFCGHVGPEGDDQLGYRPADEISSRLAADPLALLCKRVGEVWPSEALQKFEREINAEIATAIERAKAAPFPAIDVPLSSVSANTYDPVVREFVDGAVSQFKGNQSEAKLAPY
jgi:TPP-dependent pyruvate/acetoin dehydrogenase alpha subunit